MDTSQRSFLHDVSALLFTLRRLQEGTARLGLSPSMRERLENARRELVAVLDEAVGSSPWSARAHKAAPATEGGSPPDKPVGR